MPNSNRLTIDLAAASKNLQAIQNLVGEKTTLMPMVKASAYGTDASRMVHYLEESLGMALFGLSHVSEGIFLRKAGVKSDLFIISVIPNEIPAIVKYDLSVSISDLKMVRLIASEAALQGKRAALHLHIDTGMKRFGCLPEEALAIAKEIVATPSLELVGVMTHFVASNNSLFDSRTENQIETFKMVVERLKQEGITPRFVHAANTAGALRFALPFCNLARIGIGIFGLYSSTEEREKISYSPALTLESSIASIHICKQGETVGYVPGYTVVQAEERVAVVSIGYHDGIHLPYSEKGYVLIRGKRAPLIGRICMDFLMVNVSEVEEAEVGDTVLLFGKELPAETFASFAKTNVRELIACLGPRVARHFVFPPTFKRERSSLLSPDYQTRISDKEGSRL